MKISIVTPSYNQGRFIEKTINSILDQGYPDLEYIIIDGGSTDDSVEIIRRYEKHLHYWCSEPDGGQYHAINKGFQLATGEIFAWLNSDDEYVPGALEKVATVFQQLPDVSWVTTLTQFLIDNESKRRDRHRMTGYDSRALLDGLYLKSSGFRFGFIQQESTFWRRNMWNLAGGLNTQYKLAADFDLWTKFYRHKPLFGIDAPIGAFRRHDRNRSLDLEQYLAEAFHSLDILRKELSWPGHNNWFDLQERFCSLPGGNSVIRSLRQFIWGTYSGQNIYPVKNGENSMTWEVRSVRF